MQLTKNFSVYEMTKSETALRRGLDNTPSPAILDNLYLLCTEILQPIRDYYGKGVKVNSGYRSPAVNSAVGGSRTSDHCKGMAADIEIPGIPNYELASFIADNFQFRQLILEFYTPGIPDSGWVHVSYDLRDLRNQILTAVSANGRTIYKIGLIE